MLAIRLQRIGKKHQPSFRVVVSERRSKLGGPPVEDLGSYDPRGKKMTVNKDRVLHWLQAGAKASPTVHNLLVENQVISGPKAAIKMRKKTAEETTAAPQETKVVEAKEVAANKEMPKAEADTAETTDA